MISHRMCVLLFGLLVAPIARADVTGIVVFPSGPVMGETVIYAAINDGTKPVASYQWEYKFTSGSCPGTWVVAPGNESIVSFYESRPGTWQVRLTATYATEPPMGMPPPPAVVTENVTIAPATSVIIDEGLETPTNRNAPLLVKFRLKAGIRDCGPNLMGIVAQEKITNRTYLSPPFIPATAEDSPWQPETPHANFKLEGNQIHDTKGVFNVDLAIWNACPAPSTIYSRTQHLRLKYVDPCGTTKYIPLGAVQLDTIKLNDDEWKLTSGVVPP